MDVLELADWRRRVAELYTAVRQRGRDDPATAHREWRQVRDGLFAEHPQSPLPRDRRASFSGLPVPTYDPAFRFTAAVDPDVTGERFPVGTSGGGVIEFVRVGRVHLPIGDLDLFWLDAYGGGLFLPFRDATSGDGSYGGGRYLLDSAKGADLGVTDAGELICDFNFAYHPSCFHAPQWNCPLAPPDNRLDAPVPVGELAQG